MKQIMSKLRFFTPVATMLVVIVLGIFVEGCQKSTETQANSNTSAIFDATSAKEWYYGSFKKSAEWESSPDHGKKLPDWKNGIYRKVGDMEIVEFPLMKKESKLTLMGTKGLTEVEKKRLASASLTRIVFIKKDGKVSVRELDYIPEWGYLNQRNFDISGVSMGKEGNDFSGNLIVKDWKGNIIKRWKIKDGVRGAKLEVGNYSINTPYQSDVISGPSGCSEEMCDVTVYFYMESIGDAWVVTEVYDYDVLGCYQVYAPCGDGENSCVGMSPVECECQTYGTGCDGFGGEGGGEEVDCNQAQQDAQQQLNEFSEAAPAVEFQKVGLTTPAGVDPISGSFTWVVAEHLFGSWYIKAKCDFKYYHSIEFNASTNAIEHKYNLIDFQTNNGYYVGSHITVTSTYTTSAPTLNEVRNNNTSQTKGYSLVRGVLRNKSNIPLCNLVLDTEVEIENSMTFTPQ